MTPIHPPIRSSTRASEKLSRRLWFPPGLRARHFFEFLTVSNLPSFFYFRPAPAASGPSLRGLLPVNENAVGFEGVHQAGGQRLQGSRVRLPCCGQPFEILLGESDFRKNGLSLHGETVGMVRIPFVQVDDLENDVCQLVFVGCGSIPCRAGQNSEEQEHWYRPFHFEKDIRTRR